MVIFGAPNSANYIFLKNFFWFVLPFGKQLVCQFCFLVSKEKTDKKPWGATRVPKYMDREVTAQVFGSE